MTLDLRAMLFIIALLVCGMSLSQNKSGYNENAPSSSKSNFWKQNTYKIVIASKNSRYEVVQLAIKVSDHQGLLTPAHGFFSCANVNYKLESNEDLGYVKKIYDYRNDRIYSYSKNNAIQLKFDLKRDLVYFDLDGLPNTEGIPLNNRDRGNKINKVPTYTLRIEEDNGKHSKNAVGQELNSIYQETRVYPKVYGNGNKLSDFITKTDIDAIKSTGVIDPYKFPIVPCRIENPTNLLVGTPMIMEYNNRLAGLYHGGLNSKNNHWYIPFNGLLNIRTFKEINKTIDINRFGIIYPNSELIRKTLSIAKDAPIERVIYVEKNRHDFVMKNGNYIIEGSEIYTKSDVDFDKSTDFIDDFIHVYEHFFNTLGRNPEHIINFYRLYTDKHFRYNIQDPEKRENRFANFSEATPRERIWVKSIVLLAKFIAEIRKEHGNWQSKRAEELKREMIQVCDSIYLLNNLVKAEQDDKIKLFRKKTTLREVSLNDYMQLMDLLYMENDYFNWGNYSPALKEHSRITSSWFQMTKFKKSLGLARRKCDSIYQINKNRSAEEQLMLSHFDGAENICPSYFEDFHWTNESNQNEQFKIVQNLLEEISLKQYGHAKYSGIRYNYKVLNSNDVLTQIKFTHHSGEYALGTQFRTYPMDKFSYEGSRLSNELIGNVICVLADSLRSQKIGGDSIFVKIVCHANEASASNNITIKYKNEFGKPNNITLYLDNEIYTLDEVLDNNGDNYINAKILAYLRALETQANLISVFSRNNQKLDEEQSYAGYEFHNGKEHPTGQEITVSLFSK